MGGHRIAMLGGGIWSLFRFVVIALLVLRLVPADPLFHMNLLWIGAPALIMVALFAGTAFLPEAERYYLPLLRIGSLLAAVADAAAVLGRSYIPVAERVGTASEPIGRLVFIIVYGILAVDLLIFAALISYQSMQTHKPEQSETQPEYESTDVEDD
jgi:hypothetical protein